MEIYDDQDREVHDLHHSPTPDEGAASAPAAAKGKKRPGLDLMNVGRVLLPARRTKFGRVPHSVLSDRSLSHSSRLVVAHLIGKKEGWIPVVSELMSTLGLTDFGWRSIRDELKAANIITGQHKKSFGRGLIAWELEVDLRRYE